MRLPWTMRTVPHAVLDILRGCNIRCRDCYNLRPARIKPLAEITAELDQLQRLRRLQSLSIVGGEPLLHPQLPAIIRLIKSRGLHVELFTNGVALTDPLLAHLKQAGADVIFLHIEDGQQRPDLPAPAPAPVPAPAPGSGLPPPNRADTAAAALRRLRDAKAAQIAAHGIEPGLAVTVYPDSLDEMDDAIRQTLESPHLCYLLVTLWRDVGHMPDLVGDLDRGMRSGNDKKLPAPPSTITPSSNTPLPSTTTLSPPPPSAAPLANRHIRDHLAARHDLTPFAALGSSRDADDLRWMSCFVATAHATAHTGVSATAAASATTGDTPAPPLRSTAAPALVARRCLRPTLLEKTFLRLARLITGRYPFYQPQNPRILATQLRLNGLAGGGLRANLRFLRDAARARATITGKRLLFQCPATVEPDGSVIHCETCPDAVLRDGHLVPLCISDRCN
jgi:hypothetical protein